MAGKVFLIGAGPGHPDLITVRGAACLQTAEVVVYDRLIDPHLLDLAPSQADRIYVGKEAARHALSQEQINRLLVDLAGQGKVVARLKGGDPFVFGRGGEEAQALADAGLQFEVVPGVSSAFAAAAYAGIPVTHRGLSSSVAVVTGHEDPDKEKTSLRWAQLARATDTLVFLMAVERLDSIIEQLLRNGRRSEEPGALIRWGTTPEQETVTAPLGQLASRAREAGIGPPAVLVVGEVVRLREALGWYDRLPLRGLRVLVTRSRDQASALSARLRELGAGPVEFPTIRIQPPESFDDMDEALRRIDQFDWAVFTSANGVASAFGRLEALGLDARAFGGTQLCAIGPATAGALKARGLRPDWVPDRFLTSAILDGFRERGVAGQRFLLARADIATAELSRGLEELGAHVENVVAYRTVEDNSQSEQLADELARGAIQIATFTSSSTVHNLMDALDGRAHLLAPVAVACIGPVTAQAARDRGLSVAVEAQEHTVSGLVDTLVAWAATSGPKRG